jgi:hypothetical protein
MKIIRLFTGPDAQSHFEEVSIELFQNPFGKNSQAFPVQSLLLGEIEIKEVSWHNPPFPQYIVMLEGRMEIEVGDGTKRIFKEGEVLLAEDTTGQGHITRAASEGVRRYMVMPLELSN